MCLLDRCFDVVVRARLQRLCNVFVYIDLFKRFLPTVFERVPAAVSRDALST